MGFLWRKNGPKQINSLYGYRTTQSMTSRETWDFAHIYAGKIYLRTGIVFFILTLLICIYFWSADDDTAGIVSVIVMTIQLIIFILTIPITESALKKNFDKNGKRNPENHLKNNSK
ncbi:SdpI family protein [Methanimicrococcus blatticola]|nr:SdpI family protein [Methanimicrococcus blatticola]MBZ3934956.1 SdpI family protein [Methanimicrococcus blatticola]MCC2508945.1 SdpI family protein [Methanimicrococcus blatticola]